jgi:hypothetical protein
VAVQRLRGSAPENAEGNDCVDHAAAAVAQRTRSRRTADDSAAHDADVQ